MIAHYWNSRACWHGTSCAKVQRESVGSSVRGAAAPGGPRGGSLSQAWPAAWEQHWGTRAFSSGSADPSVWLGLVADKEWDALMVRGERDLCSLDSSKLPLSQRFAEQRFGFDCLSMDVIALGSCLGSVKFSVWLCSVHSWKCSQMPRMRVRDSRQTVVFQFRFKHVTSFCTFDLLAWLSWI